MLMKMVEKRAKQIRDERDKLMLLASDGQLPGKEKTRRKRKKNKEAVLSNILCFSLGTILLSND
jgi:hypothetical protein